MLEPGGIRGPSGAKSRPVTEPATHGPVPWSINQRSSPPSRAMSTSFAPSAAAPLPSLSRDTAGAAPAALSVHSATPTSVLRITAVLGRAQRQASGDMALWRCPQHLFGVAALALGLATLLATWDPNQPIARFIALVGLGCVARSYQLRWVCRDRAR